MFKVKNKDTRSITFKVSNKDKHITDLGNILPPSFKKSVKTPKLTDIQRHRCKYNESEPTVECRTKEHNCNQNISYRRYNLKQDVTM